MVMAGVNFVYRMPDKLALTNPENFVRGQSTVALAPEQVIVNPVTREDIANGVSTRVIFRTLSV